jgi:cytochrome d ubiquinol oxidase subunit II
VCHLLPMIGKNDKERRVLINTVAAHWDGNQVWFITAGGAVFAAWPAVYAASFSGFYLAMLLALFALLLRPVGFDYRSKLDNPKWRNRWDWALFAGNIIPSFVFGVAFGNILQGVPFHLDQFMRPHYDGVFLMAFLELLDPFSLLCGLISVGMLTMHGALWAQKRCVGDLQNRAQAAVMKAGIFTLVAFAGAGLWIWLGNMDGYVIISQPDPAGTPNPLGKEVQVQAGALLHNYSTMPITLLAPILAFAGGALAILFSRIGKAGLGFVGSSLSIAGIIATAGVSLFPFVMPSSSVPSSGFTVWDATSSHLTLTIMFWVVVLILPVVLAYTLWCYIRMWGKVTVDDIENQSHSMY